MASCRQCVVANSTVVTFLVILLHLLLQYLSLIRTFSLFVYIHSQWWIDKLGQPNINGISFFGHYFSLFLRMFLRSCSCCFWCSSMFRLHSSFSFSISSIWSASWRLSSSARFISSLAFLNSSVNLRFSSRISLTLSGFVLFFLSMFWVSASNCRLAYAGLLLISCCHSSTFQGYHLSYMSFLPGYRQRRSVNTWLHSLSVFLPRTPPIPSISLDFVVAYQNISFPSTDFGFKVKFV